MDAVLERDTESGDAGADFAACDAQDFGGLRLVALSLAQDSRQQVSLHHLHDFGVQIGRTGSQTLIHKRLQVRLWQAIIFGDHWNGCRFAVADW